MNIQFINKTACVIGDTHTLNVVPIFNQKIPEKFCNGVFFHCGDCGEGFHHPKKERSLLKKLHEYLYNINSHLIICRGNHSDPAFFNDDHWANTEFNDRIYFAPDYSTFQVNDKKFQLIGGSTSIDRCERLPNRSWWENEIVNFQPDRVERVDILITHSAPHNAGIEKADCNSTVRHYHAIETMEGNDLLGELANEQKIMQEISDLSGCSSHYFGHYHTSHFYTDPSHGRKYVGLNINEFKEIQ
jgi:predicted phosphodiesterase